MFNETRLLDDVAYGSQFGHEFNTRITTLRSGHERRTAAWSRPLGRYSLSYDVLEPDGHQKVLGAHMACMGSLIAFRFKDWTDFQAEQELIGVGTGAIHTYQLIKAYHFGPLRVERLISKPVAGMVEVFEGGELLPATIDYTTGQVTLSAPPGSPITWSGEFDVPVRFESDRLDFDPVGPHEDGFLFSANVDLVEVRL